MLNAGRNFVAEPARRSRAEGFSLIEMLVVISLLGILAAVGYPSLGAYLANQKIRASAEAFYSGLQTAKAEAVSRNERVQFVLTNSVPGTGTVDSLTPSSTGSNWVVRRVITDPATGAVTYEYLTGKLGAEGGGRADGTSVTVSGFVSATAVSDITFTPLSNTTGLAGIAEFRFSNPAGGACVLNGGPMQCLKVEVSPGGRVHLCDPTAALGDSRRCLT